MSLTPNAIPGDNQRSGCEKQLSAGYCRLCSSPDLEVLFEVRTKAGRASRSPFQLVCCRNCKLLSVVPDPTQEELETLYEGTDYLHGLFGNHKWQTWVMSKHWMPVMRRIENRRGVGKILDVGCSDGLFLNAVKDRGWQVYGTETNAANCELVRKRYGIEVQNSSVYDMSWPDDFFDVVRLSHVLEHLTEPVIALKCINRVLKRGGLLNVGVPNFDTHVFQLLRPFRRTRLGSILIRILGSVDPPHHLQSWSTKTIHLALKKTGFDSVWEVRRSDMVPLIEGFRMMWLITKGFSIPLRTLGSGLIIETLAEKCS